MAGAHEPGLPGAGAHVTSIAQFLEGGRRGKGHGRRHPADWDAGHTAQEHKFAVQVSDLKRQAG